VPLSEHEQRVFDEIERSLADDPKFASAVRSHDPRHRSRRRMIIAGVITLAGLALLVAGVMAEYWLGIAGAVVMFAGMIFALQTQRKLANGELSAVDGKARRTAGKSSRGSKTQRRSGNSWGDRMEERWRRRRDNGWQ